MKELEKGKGWMCVRKRKREKESEISEERGDIKYSCHTWRFWKCKKLFVQTFFLLCSVLENCFMSEKVCTKFPKALLLLYQFQIYCWIIFSFIVIYDIFYVIIRVSRFQIFQESVIYGLLTVAPELWHLIRSFLGQKMKWHWIIFSC